MGLSGCYAVIKYYMMVVNLIFLLLGIAVMVRSVWLLIDPSFHVHMAQFGVDYHTGIYIFNALGVLMFIMGCLGFRGAYRESPCMLVLFFCFLLIIVVAEIAAVMLAYSKSVTLENDVEMWVRSTVQKEYGIVDTPTAVLDAIQEELHCCGVTGPQDWADSEYNKVGKGTLELTLSSLVQIYRIPTSCCRDGIDETVCESAVQIGIGAQISNVIYSEGCFSKLIDMFHYYMSIINVVGFGIGIVQCLSLICCLIMCGRIRNMYRYKVLSNACSEDHLRHAGGVHTVSLAVGNLHQAEMAAKYERDQRHN